MPWIDDDDLVVASPRVPSPRVAARFEGELDIDRGWAELAGVAVAEVELALDDCEEFVLTEATLADVVFAPGADTVAEVRHVEASQCDFSHVTFRSVRGVRFVDCKFVGTDFSRASLNDVVFERCSFRLVNMRMAVAERIEFRDCTLDDVDMYESQLTDVDFSGSRLSAVVVDRVRATRCDLRCALDIEITNLSRLNGWTITEAQLPELMHTLAFAFGLNVARDS